MKKRVLRILCAAIAALLLALPLASCGAKDAVMTYEGYSFNTNFYTYWLSSFKANFLYSYYDVVDTEEYFDSVISDDGKTADQVMTEMSDDIIKTYLVAEYFCDKYGISPTENMLKAIDEQLERILTEQADGSKNAFNAIAAEYGINYKMLSEIYIIEAKAELFYQFYAQNFLTPTLTDDMRSEYCKNNYAKCDFIYVSTQYRYNTNEEGKFVFDENGSYLIDLTEEEKKDKQSKISELAAKLNESNFDSLRKEYNEDPSADEYKNGYYFSFNMEYNESVLTAAQLMDEGEIRRVDTDYGVYFLRKHQTEGDAYSKEENADFFTDFDTLLVQYLFDKMMAEETAKVVINEENKKGISIKTVSPCSYF